MRYRVSQNSGDPKVDPNTFFIIGLPQQVSLSFGNLHMGVSQNIL